MLVWNKWIHDIWVKWASVTSGVHQTSGSGFMLWFWTERLFCSRREKRFSTTIYKQNWALQSVLLLYLLKRICSCFTVQEEITVKLYSEVCAVYVSPPKPTVLKIIIKKWEMLTKILLLTSFIAQMWTGCKRSWVVPMQCSVPTFCCSKPEQCIV